MIFHHINISILYIFLPFISIVAIIAFISVKSDSAPTPDQFENMLKKLIDYLSQDSVFIIPILITCILSSITSLLLMKISKLLGLQERRLHPNLSVSTFDLSCLYNSEFINNLMSRQSFWKLLILRSESIFSVFYNHKNNSPRFLSKLFCFVLRYFNIPIFIPPSVKNHEIARITHLFQKHLASKHPCLILCIASQYQKIPCSFRLIEEDLLQIKKDLCQFTRELHNEQLLNSFFNLIDHNSILNTYYAAETPTNNAAECHRDARYVIGFSQYISSSVQKTTTIVNATAGVATSLKSFFHQLTRASFAIPSQTQWPLSWDSVNTALKYLEYPLNSAYSLAANHLTPQCTAFQQKIQSAIKSPSFWSALLRDPSLVTWPLEFSPLKYIIVRKLSGSCDTEALLQMISVFHQIIRLAELSDADIESLSILFANLSSEEPNRCLLNKQHAQHLFVLALSLANDVNINNLCREQLAPELKSLISNTLIQYFFPIITSRTPTSIAFNRSTPASNLSHNYTAQSPNRRSEPL